jgi:hypothetical protein
VKVSAFNDGCLKLTLRFVIENFGFQEAKKMEMSKNSRSVLTSIPKPIADQTLALRTIFVWPFVGCNNRKIDKITFLAPGFGAISLFHESE